jgi:hypothetical protein
MSFSWGGRAVPEPVEPSRAQRRGHETAPVLAPRDPSHLLAMQRLAGNRAASTLVAVQRCGPVSPDQCPCHDEEGTSEESGHVQPAERRSPRTDPGQGS